MSLNFGRSVQFTVFAAVLAAPGMAQVVVKTVPWIPSNPSSPHTVISGVSATLAGAVSVGTSTDTFTYSWDFGDGSDTELRRRIESVAAQLLDSSRPGDFNQAIMELGAMVCTPRGPQCLVCPVEHHCKTKGEHKTTPRAQMLSRDAGHALVVRDVVAGGEQVLLEQRPQSHSVMPGLWELPVLRETAVAEADLRMTVRHAIMQVNYTVRIRVVPEHDVDTLTVVGGVRRWVAHSEAAGMALTGLARKVLKRARLLGDVPRDGKTAQIHDAAD